MLRIHKPEWIACGRYFGREPNKSAFKRRCILITLVGMTLCDLSVSYTRTRWDGCEPLPPRYQGPCHRLLLHVGGHHHACHYPGICAGCKRDTHNHKRTCRNLKVRVCIVYCCLSLQKINRKKHFSKTKHSKFNESGQLSAFYLFSFGWGASILLSVCTVNKPPFFFCSRMFKTTKLSITGMQNTPP